MPYKYISTGSPISGLTPKEELTNSFQASLDEYFSVATSYQPVQVESVFGGNVFISENVRINAAVSSPTGERRGDDFKRILFKNLTHSYGLGSKYYFEGNYWLTTFTEIIMSPGNSALVQRCNEYLRWIDDDGNYFEEPCVIDYQIARSRDTTGATNPVVPSGFFDIYCQLNDRTKYIKGNQRFIFGRPENRTCFKVFGQGVQNMHNQETSDDESGTLLILTVGGNYINPDTDDLVAGIADRYKDYNNFTSASMAGSYSIIATPEMADIIESGSAIYDVRYYSGSTMLSGSFVFSVSGSSVPTDHYSFSAIDANSFYVINHEKYPEGTLDILCSGSSGSRVLNLELRGAW
jgi:hypothetical protein